MDLTRSVVELPGDGVEVILGVPGQVRAFGQALTQQAMGVFVATPLPKTVRVRKEHGAPRHFRQSLMPTHLLALVIGQGFSHGLWYPIEYATEALQGRQGGRLLEPDQQDQRLVRSTRAPTAERLKADAASCRLSVQATSPPEGSVQPRQTAAYPNPA